VAPDTPLLYVLRNDLKLDGPKFGCGLGQCGACTVIVQGRAIRSCSVRVDKVEGKPITTLEGLGTLAKPHPVQAAFIQAQAAQCGYCINGMIMTAAAFLDRNPNPTDPAIRQALSGNLCRCGTHLEILRAVRMAVSAERKGGSAQPHAERKGGSAQPHAERKRDSAQPQRRPA
jgi:nicotinate dehydrogenase subunit A